MRLTPLMTALAPLLLITPGCETPIGGCTEAGCSDAVTLNLHFNELEVADYRIELLIEDDIAECTFFVNEAGALEGLQCDSAYLYIDSDYEAAVPDGAQARDPLPEPTLKIRVYRQDIEDFDLVVLRDESETYREALSPSYEEFYPNGEKCPPVCKNATVDVFI